MGLIDHSAVNTYLLVIIAVGICIVISRVFRDSSILRNAKIFGYKKPETDVIMDLKCKAVDLMKQTAIIAIDSGGKIRLFNVGAELMFEYQQAEVLGTDASLIIPDKYKTQHNEGLRKMREAGPNAVLKRHTYDLEGLNKSGKIFPIKITLVQTKNQEGHQLETYYISYIEDVTEQLEKDQKMKLELDLYKQGEYIAEIGTWKLNTITNKFTWTENFLEKFEWRGAGKESPAFMAKVVERDKPFVRESVRKAFETGEDYNIIYEVDAKHDGNIIVECRGRCEKDSDNNVVSITGTLRILRNTNDKNKSIPADRT